MNIDAKLCDVRNILDAQNTIGITAHIGPDGDAIGASLSLGNALKAKGKTVYFFFDDYHNKYNFLLGESLIYNGELNDVRLDCFVVLDCSSRNRLGINEVLLDKTELTICIDHHIATTEIAKVSYIQPEASSTCELIYELLNGWVAIDKDIATCIYAGMVFDTGGFRHSSTTSKTYRIAAELLDKEIEFTEIYNTVEHSHSLSEAKALKLALNNLVINKKKGVAFSSLTKKELESEQVSYKDCGSIVEYLMGIRGVEVSIMLHEKDDNEFKVSFRSKKLNVAEVAAKFGGGGHKLASGCTINGNLDDIIKNVMAAIDGKLDTDGR